MNVCEIITTDIANGPGMRVSVFVSGCRNRCPGCFQPETWDFSYGQPFTRELQDQILKELQKPYYEGLTLLGGDPMEPENQEGLLPFLIRLRAECQNRSIWAYTGYLFEDLLPGGLRCTSDTAELLKLIDVLVDGRFEEDKKDIRLAFKGSTNQRILDVPASLAQGRAVLLEI